MMVTECAPCRWLMDCIKRRHEPSNEIKAKVMLDRAKSLAYLHENVILHRDTLTKSLPSHRTKSSRST